jgi:hypothetical protein
MHIAKSVVNRILNVANDIEPPPISIDMPSIPEQQPIGIDLETKLSMPTPEVSAPDGMALQDVMGDQSIL